MDNLSIRDLLLDIKLIADKGIRKGNISTTPETVYIDYLCECFRKMLENRKVQNSSNVDILTHNSYATCINIIANMNEDPESRLKNLLSFTNQALKSSNDNTNTESEDTDKGGDGKYSAYIYRSDPNLEMYSRILNITNIVSSYFNDITHNAIDSKHCLEKIEEEVINMITVVRINDSSVNSIYHRITNDLSSIIIGTNTNITKLVSIKSMISKIKNHHLDPEGKDPIIGTIERKFKHMIDWISIADNTNSGQILAKISDANRFIHCIVKNEVVDSTSTLQLNHEIYKILCTNMRWSNERKLKSIKKLITEYFRNTK